VPKKKDERPPADDSSFPEGPIPPMDASVASTEAGCELHKDEPSFRSEGQA
jgi:hypothetical protein